MRPEKLILKGVYSYKNETEIDFSTLCKADLFGIFGNVGSGKSAVLEAITYVLFGRIERLPASRLTYNMMNLCSDRMLIDFTFRQAGGRYRFTFEARRNKKNFEKIETPSRGGYVEKDGEWLPLFDKDSEVNAEGVIGLNYDNFRRTVIVPQGRFQEFLHLEKGKRTEMLMELFQLDRFDLFASASALAGINSRMTAGVEGEMSGLSDVDESGLDAAEAELGRVEKQLTELELKIRKSDGQLSEWAEIRRLYSDYAGVKKAIDSKQEMAAGIEERKVGLLRFERCRDLFRTDLAALEAVRADLDNAEAGLIRTAAVLNAEKEASEKAGLEFGEIKAEHLNLEQMKKEAEWLRIMSELKDDEAAAAGLRAAIEVSMVEKAELAEKSSACSRELEQVGAELSGLEDGLLPADIMAQFSSAFSAVADQKNTINVEEANLKEAETAADKINSDIVRLDCWRQLKAAGGAAEPPVTAGQAEEFLTDAEESVSAAAGALRQKQLAAGISNEVRKLAESLLEGKPCPVCGAVEHPAPAAGAADGDDDLKTEEDALDELQSLLGKTRQELSRIRRNESVLSGRIESSRERLSAAKGSLAGLLEQFPSGPFTPDAPEAFSDAWEDFVEADEKRQHLKQMISALTAEAEKCRRSVQQKEGLLNELKIKLAAAEAGISGKRERIDDSFYEDSRDRTVAELSGDFRQLESGIERISAEYQRLEKESRDAGLKYEKRKTEHSLNEVRRDELAGRSRSLGEQLEQKIEKSDYSGIGEVAAVLGSNLSPEKERAEIDEFIRETDRLKAEYERLERELDGRDYDVEKHRSAEVENTVLKQEQKEAAAASGRVRSLITDMSRRLERKNELKIELDRLSVRGENINTLRNLFKGKKFIDYAATVYLRQLCEAANARFRKLTRESLRLELDESNNFIVRDYLNEGKIRSVKTLSGGQTFQAAFSLSLALADSIGKERSGFFFLDEGFGSLDRESLALVFESLKSLKDEERTVGIISHVEELKQEIDTYITVNKETEEGSLIENSWNS